MRRLSMIPMALVLSACVDGGVTEPEAQQDTSATMHEQMAQCAHGVETAQWSSYYREFHGPIGAYSHVIIEPNVYVMRWVWSAEITNWGLTPYRQPFLRSSGEPGEGGGIVVMGDPSITAMIAPFQAIILPANQWIPVPPGWELNAFIPHMAAEQRLAITLGIVTCSI